MSFKQFFKESRRDISQNILDRIKSDAEKNSVIKPKLMQNYDREKHVREVAKLVGFPTEDDVKFHSSSSDNALKFYKKAYKKAVHHVRNNAHLQVVSPGHLTSIEKFMAHEMAVKEKE